MECPKQMFALRNFKAGSVEHSAWRARGLADFVTSNICLGHVLLALLGSVFFLYLFVVIHRVEFLEACTLVRKTPAHIELWG